MLRLCYKNKSSLAMVKEYVGEGGNTRCRLSYQSAPPSLNRLMVNITRCLKMKFPFQGAALKAGMNPAGRFTHMLLVHIAALSLDGTSSQNQTDIQYPISPCEPSWFHQFCSTEVLIVAVAVLLSLNDRVSVYASVFQAGRETEKEADFTLCT